ncbi:MAG: hypothetical protein LBF85_05735 [Tannerella sp.]|jgi:hypothetical protein|nr:hypothetical protein [Tannerella sp.]
MKIFTLCITNENLDKNPVIKKAAPKPRIETLEFIRQFARVYRYEAGLKEPFGSYILN